MVQFNLLPDVKKDYIKTKRTKRVIASFSFLITSIFVGVTVLLFLFVRFAQTKSISDLTDDIQAKSSQIQSTEDLNKKLTVQNQLNILTPLHESKPKVSRVFDYVRFFSPETTEIRQIDVNTVSNTMIFSGSISTLAEANRLVENIKAVRYATYPPGDEAPETVTEYVYNVIDSSVSSDGDEARFEVEVEFNRAVFDNTVEIVMQLRDKRITTTTEVKE